MDRGRVDGGRVKLTARIITVYQLRVWQAKAQAAGDCSDTYSLQSRLQLQSNIILLTQLVVEVCTEDSGGLAPQTRLSFFKFQKSAGH